jgi:hypothetical protein
MLKIKKMADNSENKIQSLRYLLALTALLLLTTCLPEKTDQTSERSDNQVDVGFAAFLNALPNQALAIKISCGLAEGTVSSREFEKYTNYIPKAVDRILGTINSQSEECRLIIYGQTGDDVYPILFSYDNSGNVVDSVSLILHGCGGADDKAIPHSYVFIDKDLTITLLDTTRLIHYRGNSRSVDDYIIDSLRISKKVINIDHKGKFVKQSMVNAR